MLKQRPEGTTRSLLFEHMYSKMVHTYLFTKNDKNKRSVFLRFLFLNRRYLTMLYRYMDSMCLTFQEKNCRLELKGLISYNLALYLDFESALIALKLTHPRRIRLELDKNFDLDKFGPFVDYLGDVSHLQFFQINPCIFGLIEQQRNLESLCTEHSLLEDTSFPTLTLDCLYMECWESGGVYDLSPLIHHGIKNLDLTHFRNSIFKYMFSDPRSEKNNSVHRLSIRLSDVSFTGQVFPFIRDVCRQFEGLKELKVQLELYEKTSKGARFAQQIIGLFDDLTNFGRLCSEFLDKICVEMEDYTYLKKQRDLKRFLDTVQDHDQLKHSKFEVDSKQRSTRLMHFQHSHPPLQLDFKISAVFVQGNVNYEEEFMNWAGLESSDEEDVGMLVDEHGWMLEDNNWGEYG